MDSTTQSASPLRQRMLDDMRMRKLELKTQQAYVRAVRKLAAHLRRSPDTASAEDLRNFQLHLVDTGCSPITLNATITGLKFFFDITLSRPELMGFHRIRHYGLLANGNRRYCLALARTALQAKVEVPTGDPSVRAPAFVCRHCGRPLLIVEVVLRERPSIRAPPSWRLARPGVSKHRPLFIASQCGVDSCCLAPPPVQRLRRAAHHGMPESMAATGTSVSLDSRPST
jgi:hypothetical protein